MPNHLALPPDLPVRMLTGYLEVILENEMSKGCLSTPISPTPVCLEPPFRPFDRLRELLDSKEQPPYLVDPNPPSEKDLTRLKVWASSDYVFDWRRVERFIRQLRTLKHRLAFDITGNQHAVLMSFLCHREDQTVLSAVFSAVFGDCELAPAESHPLTTLDMQMWEGIVFNDYYTPPPYSHLLTRPAKYGDEPPLKDFVNTLRIVQPPGLATYQIVLQPVAADHNWHRNVEALLDVEYTYKMCMNYDSQIRSTQQLPSNALAVTANEVDAKSNADRPFFCAAVRIGLLGYSDKRALDLLRGITTPMNLFLHGGQPLGAVSHCEYSRHLRPPQIRDIFLLARSHRAGAILHSQECGGLLHMPPVREAAQKGVAVATIDPFPIKNDIFSSGIHIGHTVRMPQTREVFIPDYIEMCHSHLIGRPGSGKSRLLLYMCLDAIRKGHGVALLDPHGEAAQLLLGHMKKEWLDRVVYFNPGDPNHVPLLNPLAPRTGLGADRITDELLTAFIQTREGFGDRLATLLRQAFYGLIQTGQGTLGEVGHLFSPKSEQRKAILNRILDVVVNDKAREFWEHEFNTYRGDQIIPVQHKLSVLLVHDTLGPMLSQSENRMDIRSILDESKIFIADLSSAGAERGDIVGALLTSLFYLVALGRSDTAPEARPPFHMYIDETHRVMSDALENMIAELRKFNVSLTVAHQYLSQWSSKRQVDALGMMGSTVAFNVTVDDAPHIARFLGPNVNHEDLTALGRREAIARIDRDVVRIMTPTMGMDFDAAIAEQAKQLSWERYCKPADVLRAELSNQRHRPVKAFVTGRKAGVTSGETPKEYGYDEFA